MGMGVDEARSDEQPVEIDYVGATELDRSFGADFGDPIPVEADVTPEPLGSGPVDDRAAPEYLWPPRW